MIIKQLFLNVTDFNSGLAIMTPYILGAYSDFEKVEKAQSNFLNNIFPQVKFLNTQTHTTKQNLRLEAKKSNQPQNVNLWEDENLKTLWKEADVDLDTFLNTELPLARGAFFAITGEDGDYEMEFEIITLVVQ